MAIPNVNVKDIIESVSKWIDDHFSFRYFSMFFVLCGVFLLLINRFLFYLGLPPVPPVYRVAAAAGVLLFGTGSLFFSVESGLKKWKEWWRRHRRLVELRDHLNNLPVDEGAIIREFCRTKKGSLMLQPGNGAVCNLRQRGIIYQSGSVGTTFEGIEFSLTKQSLKYFQKPEFQRMLLDRFGDTEEDEDESIGERTKQWLRDHPSDRPKKNHLTI
jgi:hypothetical protein